MSTGATGCDGCAGAAGAAQSLVNPGPDLALVTVRLWDWGRFALQCFAMPPGWPALKPFGLRAPAEADFIQLSKIRRGERLI
jgi:hypothetical protein